MTAQPDGITCACGKHQMPDQPTLEQILHDFVVNLHAYSNGIGNAQDYQIQLANAIQLINNHQIRMLQTLLEQKENLLTWKKDDGSETVYLLASAINQLIATLKGEK